MKSVKLPEKDKVTESIKLGSILITNSPITHKNTGREGDDVYLLKPLLLLTVGIEVAKDGSLKQAVLYLVGLDVSVFETASYNLEADPDKRFITLDYRSGHRPTKGKSITVNNKTAVEIIKALGPVADTHQSAKIDSTTLYSRIIRMEPIHFMKSPMFPLDGSIIDVSEWPILAISLWTLAHLKIADSKLQASLIKSKAPVPKELIKKIVQTYVSIQTSAVNKAAAEIPNGKIKNIFNFQNHRIATDLRVLSPTLITVELQVTPMWQYQIFTEMDSELLSEFFTLFSAKCPFYLRISADVFIGQIFRSAEDAEHYMADRGIDSYSISELYLFSHDHRRQYLFYMTFEMSFGEEKDFIRKLAEQYPDSVICANKNNQPVIGSYNNAEPVKFYEAEPIKFHIEPPVPEATPVQAIASQAQRAMPVQAMPVQAMPVQATGQLYVNNSNPETLYVNGDSGFIGFVDPEAPVQVQELHFSNIFSRAVYHGAGQIILSLREGKQTWLLQATQFTYVSRGRIVIAVDADKVGINTIVQRTIDSSTIFPLTADYFVRFGEIILGQYSNESRLSVDLVSTFELYSHRITGIICTINGVSRLPYFEDHIDLHPDEREIINMKRELSYVYVPEV